MPSHSLHGLLLTIMVATVGCRDAGDASSQPADRSTSQTSDRAPSSTAVDTHDLTAIPGEHLDQIVRLFNQGVGLMDRYQPAQAIKAFEEVVRLAPHWLTGRLNLAIALLNLQQEEAYVRAEKELQQVLAAEPDNCHARFSLGMLLSHLARFDEARSHFEQAVKLDPQDADALFQLARLLEDEDPTTARQHYQAALVSMPHHESACYRLQRLLQKDGEMEAAKELLLRFQSLKAKGAGVSAGMKYGEMGRYAMVIRALGDGPLQTGDGTVPTFANIAEQVGLTQVAGHAAWPGPSHNGTSFGPGLAVADVDGDGDLDIFVPGGASTEDEHAAALYRHDGQLFAIDSDSGIDGRRTVAAFFGDYNGDGAPDLFLTCKGPNRLYQNDGQGTFQDVTVACGVAGGPFLSTSAAWADADHDGDLDLFVANYGPADQVANLSAGAPNALWRNNGNGTFTDVAAEAQIEDGPSATGGVCFLDVDDDRDLDVYLINDQTPNRLFLNQRAGQYIEATSRFETLADTPEGQAASGLGVTRGDVDGNGLEDLLLVRGQLSPSLFLQHHRGQFEEDPAFAAIARKLGGAVGGLLGDLDLDGQLDLVLFGAGRTDNVAHWIMMNQGGGRFGTPTQLGPTTSLPDAGGAVLVDLNGDGMLELVVARAGKPPQLWRAEPPPGRHWLEVIPRMTGDDNLYRIEPTAMGLLVELKTGLQSQVASVTTSGGYLSSPPPRVHFGMGQHGQADYVRLAWPDAVLQSELEIAADQPWRVTKVVRKPSSCPILFTWNGEQFAYVTDLLGGGGLGFFIRPGDYAPPDPTEDVRIPPELVQARDGKYLLRMTEPLEEVAYIDQLTLTVYDHPADWQVYLDERFAAAPPAPTGQPVAFTQPIFPQAAKDYRGRDVLSRLLRVDRQYVEPPVDPRFIGYADDHWVELHFGDRLRKVDSDARLVLYLHGWVEYTFSHVNYAAWQAGVTLQSPSIEVPDGSGGWQTVVEDAGFPAGLPRMMTLDVSSLPLREHGRMRIRTNMEVFWDQAFVAVEVAQEEAPPMNSSPDENSAPRIVAHHLEPTAATLRHLGFPREYSPDGMNPTRYDYHRLDHGITFKNMTGDYTRWGEVRPLLQHVDDQFVIMGRGEEIALEFDAHNLPPLAAGWSRTLVLHCDGYCKDMDLYTAKPDTVEPLPWHGMQNYPPENRRPRDPSYDEYRNRWNTRRVPE